VAPDPHRLIEIGRPITIALPVPPAPDNHDADRLVTQHISGAAVFDRMLHLLSVHETARRLGQGNQGFTAERPCAYFDSPLHTPRNSLMPR